METIRYFHSGTPRVDKSQLFENSLCNYRLFSMHGTYEQSVLKWLEHSKFGVLNNLDKPYPSHIILDSGAFTSWKSGHVTTVQEVISAYSKFFDRAKNHFKEIYAISLDVIPGEFGRDPTLEEVNSAIETSDINYRILLDKFGPRIIPVFHQGENIERCLQLEEMVSGKGDYICVSPRNDLPEGKRWPWAQQVHAALKPTTRTHGLATTGNQMLERVSWYSVDSATWKLAAVYGKIVHFWDKGNKPKYTLIAISNEGGLDRFQGNHFDTMPRLHQLEIEAKVGKLGFTIEQLKKDMMSRSMYNMSELERFMNQVHQGTKVKYTHQKTLFGV